MSFDAALPATLEPVVSRLEEVAGRLKRAAEVAARSAVCGVRGDRAAFTVREVATLLQVAPETVREWFYADRLKGLQTGNRILVWRWSLMEFMGLEGRTRTERRAKAAHDGLLSVEEVCSRLGITGHTFYSYRKKYPTFRTLKVGGKTYMRRETLERFLTDVENAQAS